MGTDDGCTLNWVSHGRIINVSMNLSQPAFVPFSAQEIAVVNAFVSDEKAWLGQRDAMQEIEAALAAPRPAPVVRSAEEYRLEAEREVNAIVGPDEDEQPLPESRTEQADRYLREHRPWVCDWEKLWCVWVAMGFGLYCVWEIAWAWMHS